MTAPRCHLDPLGKALRPGGSGRGGVTDKRRISTRVPWSSATWVPWSSVWPQRLAFPTGSAARDGFLELWLGRSAWRGCKACAS